MAKELSACVLLTLLMVINAFPQNQKQNGEPGKAEVAGYKMLLKEQAGKCILEYDGHRKGEVVMRLPPPCEFIRNRIGQAQHFGYYNKRLYGGYFTVILVVGGPADKTRADKFMTNGCGTQLQGVVLRTRGVTVKQTLGTGLIACPSDGRDEKEFAFTAYSK